MKFDPALSAGDFRLSVLSVTLPANSPVLMLPANPNRTAFVFTNPNGTVTIRPGNFDSSNQGIDIQSNSSPFVWKYSDIGAVVGMEWYAITAIGESLIIFQTIYYPTQEQKNVL